MTVTRIKTSTGWQDLSVAGPQGPQGPPGAVGIGGAMQLIADQLLSASGASFDFPNIPQSYAHLYVVGLLRSSVVSDFDSSLTRFNGDASVNYYNERLRGTGTTASAFELGAQSSIAIDTLGSNSNPSFFGAFVMEIPHYTGSHKKIVNISSSFHRGNVGGAFFKQEQSGLWDNASAINRIQFIPASAGNWVAGSRISIYGIAGPGQILTPPSLVTSLPTSPADGQEVYYLADATNGVIWHLRYRAASASANKWERVGGPPVYVEVVTHETTTSAAWANLPTPGPLLNTPLTGEYAVHFGARAGNNTANQPCQIGFGIGGADPAAGNFLDINVGGPNSQFPVAYKKRAIVLTAGQEVRLKYRNLGGTGTVAASNRWLELEPVRVG